MNGSDRGGPAATPGWARSAAPGMAGDAGAERARPARAQKRVVLGDLTNIAGGRFGAADAEKGTGGAWKMKPLDEANKLKPFFADIGLLKGKLLEEQQRRERAETELSKLKGIQASAQSASFIVLPSGRHDGSSYTNMPGQFDSEKQALTNLNKDGESTLVKERPESSSEEFAACNKEENKQREDHAILPEQEPTDGDGTCSKDISSRMGITLGGLESTVDTLIEIIMQQQSKLNMMSERSSIEEQKVTSLERERDQLCSEVAILKSKVEIPELSYGDYSVSNTSLEKTEQWLRTVEELKGQGSVNKQHVLIEISDDEETSMWYDDGNMLLNPSSTGDQGDESFQQRDSYEWFFRGNKLMLSCGMKQQLKEICGYVPPEVPFYIYQMNKSNLKPNGRVRLSAKYTSAHMLCFFHKREGCARLEIDGEDCGTVRITLGRDGRASLSSDWQGVVEAKNIKVGDICAFQLKVYNGDLKLAVHVFHVARCLVSLR